MFFWNSGKVLAVELGSMTKAMNQQDCKTWLGFIMVYAEGLHLNSVVARDACYKVPGTGIIWTG